MKPPAVFALWLESDLKILLTVHQFVPEYFSGTEILTFSVAKELLRRGHEVIVFTGYPAKQQMPDWKRFDSYVIEGIKVHRFHHAYTPMGEQHALSEIEYDNHLAAGYFSCLVDDIRPDVVHFFHLSRLGISLVDVARQKAIPAYYTPTDFWSVCQTSQLMLVNGRVCPGPTKYGGNCIKHVATLTHWRSYAALVKFLPDRVVDGISAVARSNKFPRFPFRREISALSRRSSFNVARLNALHGIFSPTRLMTDVLTRNGVDERLIIQSAFGLDISGFDEVQRQADPSGSLTIGYIGTLAPHKGCHVLLAAFLRLKTKGVRLKIYGNMSEFPEYAAKLKEQAANHDSIEFLGNFPNAQISDVLAALDALVVPSLWYENTPLVIYSALAAKCPVIVSDYPGMSEVVRDGWNGLTFEPGNVEALMNCLQRLKEDAAFLEELGNNCHKPKSIATYVDELLAMYAQTERLPLHEAPVRPAVVPYRPAPHFGYVSGWAVVGRQEPESVRIFSEGREISGSSRLQPRPDVRDGFRRSGKGVSGVSFGFNLSIVEPVSLETAVLVVNSRNGERHEVSIGRLTVGQTVTVSPHLVVGLDQVCFETIDDN